MAALQGDQGLVRLIWMRVGDIMWLSCSLPNTSVQAFTLSCGMLNTCPVEKEQHVRCHTWMAGYFYLWWCICTHLRKSYSSGSPTPKPKPTFKTTAHSFIEWVYWIVDGGGRAHRAHEQWWRLRVGRHLQWQSSFSWGRTWCQHPPCQACHRWRLHTGPRHKTAFCLSTLELVRDKQAGHGNLTTPVHYIFSVLYDDIT